MPLALKPIVLPLLLLALLAGCNPKQLSRSTDNGIHQEFQQALNAADWPRAGEIYNRHVSYFNKQSARYRPSLRLVADHLNGALEPALRRNRHALDRIDWPAPEPAWGEIEGSIAGARRAIDAYREYKLLLQPPYQSAELDKVAWVAHRLQRKILRDAPRAFAQFDHFRGISFFDVYPHELSPSRFMSQQFHSIRHKVARAGNQQLAHFFETYPLGEVLVGNVATQIRRLDRPIPQTARITPEKPVEAPVAKASRPATNPVSQPLSLTEAWEQMAASRRNARPVSSRLRNNLVVMEIRNDSRLRQRSLEFPMRLQKESGIPLFRSSVDNAIRHHGSQSADYLVIVDQARATTDMQEVRRDQVTSRLYSHSSFQPNPKYKELQQRLRGARKELRRAREEYRRALARKRKSDPNRGDAGVFADLFGTLVDAAIRTDDIDDAEKRVQRLEQQLERVPPQLEQKHFTNYSYDRVTYEASKELTVNYLALDRVTSAYVKGEIKRQFSKTFVTLSGVNNSDPDANRARKWTATDQDISSWRQSHVAITLAEIMADFKQREQQASRLPALALVQQDLHNLRDVALHADGPTRPVTGAATSSQLTGIGRRERTEFNFPTGPARPKAFALVIGVRNYDDQDVPEVEFAANDASAMRQFLIKTRGFSPDNVVVLNDPKQSQLLAYFGTEVNPRGKLHDLVEREGIEELFVFFSGHGIPTEDGVGVLLPSDADPFKPEFTGYKLDSLINNLNTLPTRNATVVIESCFSGLSAGGPLIRDASPVFLAAQPNRLSLKNGVVFTAADGREIASWDRDMRLGLFTRHLLEGFIGLADANGNGRIEVFEMEQHLREKVGRDANRRYSRRQTPQTVGQPSQVLNSALISDFTSIDQLMALGR